MKKLFLLMFIVFFSTNQAFAVAPINEDTINKAQLYGTSQSSAAIQEFFRPWTAYEEKAENLVEAESACVFTPFLLFASNARDKALKGEKPSLEDSEQIITDYCDVLSFKVQLNGKTAEFSKNSRAFLKQGKNILPALHSLVPQNAVQSDSKAVFSMQGFFYFEDQKIDKEKPVILIILTGDNIEHRFYFDLKRIK